LEFITVGVSELDIIDTAEWGRIGYDSFVESN